jgi:hypothetical protein
MFLSGNLFMIPYIDSSSGYLYLGALVVLLSIAADPFTQQLVQYEQRVVYTNDASTTVNRAGRFAKGSTIITNSTVLSSGEPRC